MKRYTMRDLSGGRVNREDENLSFLGCLEMTDWSEDEVDRLSDLEVGGLVLLSDGDIVCERTE